MINNDTYREYYKEQGLKEYHGFDFIDVLKDLSENAEPPIARLLFQEKYHEALKNLGSNRVRDFGKILYEHLNGSEEYEIVEELDSIMLRDTKVVCYKIRFKYFERVEEYFKNLGIRVKIQSEFNIYDIESRGRSLITEYLKNDESGPSLCGSGYSSDTPWVIDKKQWELTNHGGFYMPYNGIDSLRVIGIIREMKSRDYGRDNTLHNQIDFVNKSLIKNVGCGKFFEDFKILTDADIERIQKEMNLMLEKLL